MMHRIVCPGMWHIAWFWIAVALPGTPAVGDSLPCDVEDESTFEDWREWNRLTPAPVRSNGHSRNWVDIYVDDLARGTYMSAGPRYGECAMIVKPEYRSRSGESLLKLTFMVKMPAGYDPDHSDWWYGVAGSEGKLERSGRMHGCISCHRQVEETDYTFSRRLEE